MVSRRRHNQYFRFVAGRTKNSEQRLPDQRRKKAKSPEEMERIKKLVALADEEGINIPGEGRIRGN